MTLYSPGYTHVPVGIIKEECRLTQFKSRSMLKFGIRNSELTFPFSVFSFPFSVLGLGYGAESGKLDTDAGILGYFYGGLVSGDADYGGMYAAGGHDTVAFLKTFAVVFLRLGTLRLWTYEE